MDKRYLAEVYHPAFNAEFEQYQRTVTADNCVSFEGTTLQIPANRYRFHYVRVRVHVHKYTDDSMAVFHGPRKLADYDAQEKLNEFKKGEAA